jgi:hypothetical protein
MDRIRWRLVPAILVAWAGVALGATGVPRSYVHVESAIQSVRQKVEQAGQTASLTNSGWDTYFNELLGELGQYAQTTDENERLKALGKLFDRSQSLRASNWADGQAVGQALDAWLAPRIRLAWAVRQLEDAVQTGTTDPANRERWLSFLRKDLGANLATYESAGNVGDRVEALEKFHGGLNTLRNTPAAIAWSPAGALAQALSSVYERPNLEALIDFPTAWKLFAQQIVTPEILNRKGQITTLTPGPYLGFGLLPSNDSISFYNQQIGNGYTPIRGFHEQIAADPQGQRAAKMYIFSAVNTSSTKTTAYTWIRPHGIDLLSVPETSVNLSVTACPAPGGGLQRALASLIGMNQDRITNEVYQNAYPRVAAQAAQDSRELSSERTAQAKANLDAQTAPYLRGNNTAVYDQFAVTGLALASQPAYAQVGGNVQYNLPELQLFADAPQPPQFSTMAPGLTADLHLPSILTNLARGYLTSGDASTTENVVVEAGPTTDAQKPGPAVKVTRNADFAQFREIAERTKAANDPQQQVVRIKKPAQPPVFGADGQGNLVAVVRDLQIDVPVPPNAPNLGGAQKPNFYRIISPRTEIAINATVSTPAEGQPLKLNGKIVSFDPGPSAKVLAIVDNEGDAQPLGTIQNTLVLGVLRSRIQSQVLDIPLDGLPLNGFAVNEVSALDPTGWIRIVLSKL